MIARLRSLRSRLNTEENGLTLIELLVTMTLFGILGSGLLVVVLNSATNLTAVRQTTDLNEQSRLVLNRVSRELREARQIVAVTNPGGSTFDPAADSLVTFHVDFNGNGTIEPLAGDPEELTYKYQAADKRLLLQAGGLDYPILADNVETFRLDYSSRRYECDVNKDGTITWEELDSAPSPCPESVGNSNGVLDVELAAVNSVTIEFTVLTGSRRQDYRTQVDMRNRPG